MVPEIIKGTTEKLEIDTGAPGNPVVHDLKKGSVARTTALLSRG